MVGTSLRPADGGIFERLPFEKASTTVKCAMYLDCFNWLKSMAAKRLSLSGIGMATKIEKPILNKRWLKLLNLALMWLPLEASLSRRWRLGCSHSLRSVSLKGFQIQSNTLPSDMAFAT